MKKKFQKHVYGFLCLLLLCFALFVSMTAISFYNTGPLALNPKSVIGRLMLNGIVMLETSKSVESRNIGLFTYNKLFGTTTRITPKNIETLNSSLSPDGSEVAFVYRNNNDAVDFYVGLMNISDGKITTLAYNEIEDFKVNIKTSIAWSPDGESLLLSLVSSDNCFHLAVFDLADLSYKFIAPNFCKSNTGHKVKQVDLSWAPGKSPVIGVRYVSDLLIGEELPGEVDNIYAFSESLDDITWISHGTYPTWRPNTKDIAYICSEPYSEELPSLCSYAMINSIEVPLVERYGYEKYAWSPDGQSILFIDRRGESDPTYISLININSGEIIPIQELHVLSIIWGR